MSKKVPTIPIREKDVENDDRHARYQMPTLTTSIKTKGQYSSTEILGLADVAKALHVDQKCLTKWFALDFNTQIARQETLLLVLKGPFPGEDILQSLRRFINKHVLCPNCDLPELNYRVKKNAMQLKCRACPFAKKVPDLKIDRVWKLIHQCELANPSKGFESRSEASEKQKRRLEKNQEKEIEALHMLESDSVDKDDWVADLSETAVASRKEQELKSSLLADLIQ